MSRKKVTHLRGERGQDFANRMRGIPSEQILCVSLDISKYFHEVMIHNGLGEIVKPTFEINMMQSGLDQLCQAIEQAKVQTSAQVVLIGMEPTSHYFENLARHLLKRALPVTLILCFAAGQVETKPVKESRSPAPPGPACSRPAICGFCFPEHLPGKTSQ